MIQDFNYIVCNRFGFGIHLTLISKDNKRSLNSSGDSTQPNLVAVKKAKLLDEVNHQFNNRYAEDAEGPFQVVRIDIRSDQNLGNIHPMVVGKKFRVGGISVVNIEKQSEEKISILFNAAKDANDFVLSKVKEIDINWLAFIRDLSLQYTR